MQMWAVRVAAYAQPTNRPTRRLTDHFCWPKVVSAVLGAVDNDGDDDSRRAHVAQ